MCKGGHVNSSVVGVTEVPLGGAVRDWERERVLALKVLNKDLHGADEQEWG